MRESSGCAPKSERGVFEHAGAEISVDGGELSSERSDVHVGQRVAIEIGYVQAHRALAATLVVVGEARKFFCQLNGRKIRHP